VGAMATYKTRYIAFLKGINVGGHTVKMDRLRSLFADLGFDEVETFIASGNVIFVSSEGEVHKLELEIGAHLESALGYSIPTFIRSSEELRRIAACQPFSESELALEGSSLYIAFLPRSLSADAGGIEAASTDTDLFRIQGSELYWHCRTRFSDSPFSGPKLERLLGMPATVRNSTTVKKLASKIQVSERPPK